MKEIYKSKFAIFIYIIVFLLLLRLLIFPVYTRCTGKECRVYHLNRITGHAYYSPVQKAISKKEKRAYQKKEKFQKEHYEDIERYDVCRKKKCTLGNGFSLDEYLQCTENCKTENNIPDWYY